MNRYLNLGCGLRFHRDWINVDFVSAAPSVIAHNLLQGVPQADASVEVVYHSHVLEHFTQPDGQRFITECYRVLAPGGVVRIAVPDLEQIARLYLQKLEASLAGEPGAADDYDWMTLELFDQTVRNISGGGTAKWLMKGPIRNLPFIVSRWGVEAERLLKNIAAPPPPPGKPESLLTRLLSPSRYWPGVRTRLTNRLLGGDTRALKIGKFRLGGEVHQWMYDRFSLKRLLEQTGFTGVVQRTADQSYVADWTRFNLDTEPDGRVYKPDSLFMEARKPA